MSMYAGSGFIAVRNAVAGTSGVSVELFNHAASSCSFNNSTTNGSVGTAGPGSEFLGIGGYGWTSGERNIAAFYSEIIVFSQALSATAQSDLIAHQRAYFGTP